VGAERSGAGGQTREASSAEADPQTILEISPGATHEEIQAVYRARMRECHPDRVAHLGEELQRLTHSRSVEIQKAYNPLCH